MYHKKKYLILTMSGLGYLYPSIRIAKILQRHNQNVLFVSTCEHSIILSNYGISHIPMKSYNRKFLDLHRWGHTDSVIQNFKDVTKIIDSYRPDVIITSSLAMISFIIGEKYSIPVINIGFCEYLFPVINENSQTKEWRLSKFNEIYNSFKSELGLPIYNENSFSSPVIGTKYLLRSVNDFYGNNILPDHVACVGDLYLEPAYSNTLLEKFILNSKSNCRKIGYVQIGRLFKRNIIWEQLLKVLEKLPVDFIIDINRADYNIKSSSVYKNIFFSSFIPIGAFKKDIDFVICSVNTTTTISSIIHNKPMIAIPSSSDSLEFTQRLIAQKLAVGVTEISDINFNVLSEILNNDLWHLSTKNFQEKFLSYTNDVIYKIIVTV